MKDANITLVRNVMRKLKRDVTFRHKITRYCSCAYTNSNIMMNPAN